MQKVLAIAWNDIKIEFSDRATIIFFLVLPIVFTVVVGVGLGGQGSSDERLAVLVVDNDGGQLAQQLVSAISASEAVRPIASGADEAAAALGESAATLVTIPFGFSDGLMAGEPALLLLQHTGADLRGLAVQQAVQGAADSVGSAVSVALASVAQAKTMRPFASEADEAAYFRTSLEAAAESLREPPLVVETKMAAGTSLEMAEGFAQSSLGQMVTWSMLTLMGAAEALVSERLGGTLRRLLVTPTGRATILSGKVLGRLSMGLVQMLLLIAFGGIVLGVDWGRSPLALLLIVVAFALAAVALGILLATFCRTRGQAGWLGVCFSMIMAALGGAWWPIEVTPPLYQSVVRVLPTTWAMRGFTDVVVRGQSVSGIYIEVLVLLGFAAVFFAAGIRRFRFE